MSHPRWLDTISDEELEEKFAGTAWAGVPSPRIRWPSLFV